jgi:phosphoribosylglycinamide formyltransferase 1
MNITFLSSGGGGNLRFAHHAIQSGLLPQATISVIADRPCGALDYAKHSGLVNFLVKNLNESDGEFCDLVAKTEPELIITTIHKILNSEFVQLFRDKLINIHYSLLPAFSGYIGMKSVDMAIKAGCRWIGATAHVVTDEVDAGPILSQCVIPLADKLSSFEHYDAIFRCGALTLHSVIIKSAVNPIKSFTMIEINGWHHFLAPREELPSEYTSPAFWESIK